MGRSRRLLLVAAGASAVVIAGAALAVLRPWQSPPATPAVDGAANDPAQSGAPAASLPPGFPDFPLPDGATLVAATGGSGPPASYWARWVTDAPPADVSRFYRELEDAAWSRTSDVKMLDQSVFTFEDASGEFARTVVTVALTSPTVFAVALGPQHVGDTGEPDPAMPRADALPEDFPAFLAPPDAELFDAGTAGSKTAAVFVTPATTGALVDFYRAAISGTGATPEPIIDGERAAFVVDDSRLRAEIAIVPEPAGGSRVSVVVIP